MDIPFEVNTTLVRGLDYYTDTVFEFKASGIGSIDTIGAGGRYNGLVGSIGGQDQPGVGLGLGIERTLLILQAQGVELPAVKPLDIYLIGLGEAAEKEIPKLLHNLRVNGVTAEKDYLGRKMKAQMKSADRCQARYTAILGDDELGRGEITLKNMSNGEQSTVALNDFVPTVKGLV